MPKFACYITAKEHVAHFVGLRGFARGYLRFAWFSTLMVGLLRRVDLGVLRTLGFIVKQKWFEKFSSPHIIRIYLGVLRTLGFYINFRQLAINGHKYCVLAHASPLSVLKHALRRKCSLMATPSKRNNVNAQSSSNFRSVDSQTISF